MSLTTELQQIARQAIKDKKAREKQEKLDIQKREAETVLSGLKERVIEVAKTGVHEFVICNVIKEDLNNKGVPVRGKTLMVVRGLKKIGLKYEFDKRAIEFTNPLARATPTFMNWIVAKW